MMHGPAAEVGPIRVAANWPQVRLVDWDGDGHDDLWIGQPQHIANLVYRNLNRWHDGAPVFDAPKVVPIGPGAIGRLDSSDRLAWIGSVRGNGAYVRRPIKRESTGYVPGDQVSLTEASSKNPLQPPLHSAVEPTVRIIDLDADGLPDLLVGIRMTGYQSPLGIEPPGGWGWPTSFAPEGTWLGNDSLGAVVWHKNVGPAGDPSFTVGKPVTTGASGLPLFTFDQAACETVDLNGDGRLDVVVATFDRLLWFEVEKSGGGSLLTSPRVLTIDSADVLPFQRLGVLGSDLDHDGLIDLVLYGPGFLYYSRNLGERDRPQFGALREILQTEPALAVDGFAVPEIADLNGDGNPDLIVGTEDGLIRYFENAGPTGEDLPQSIRGHGLEGSHWLGDLSTSPIAPFQYKAGRYLEADGQGIRITTERNLTGPLERLWGYTAPVACDWDADGDLDLLVGCIGPFIQLYENVGTPEDARFSDRGSLQIRGQGELPNGYRVRPAVVQADGDGHLQLMAVDLTGRLMLHSRQPDSRTLTTLESGRAVPNENGQPLLAVGGEGRLNGRSILTVVDWDGDGDWDLVVGMRGEGERLRYYENVGGQTEPRLKYVGGFPTKRPGGHYQMAEFFDFDGDGLLDVVAGSDHGLIYFFRQLPLAE